MVYAPCAFVRVRDNGARGEWKKQHTMITIIVVVAVAFIRARMNASLGRTRDVRAPDGHVRSGSPCAESESGKIRGGEKKKGKKQFKKKKTLNHFIIITAVVALIGRDAVESISHAAYSKPPNGRRTDMAFEKKKSKKIEKEVVFLKKKKISFFENRFFQTVKAYEIIINVLRSLPRWPSTAVTTAGCAAAPVPRPAAAAAA